MRILIARYFQKIQYWKDEDSGHWEELRKVAASSIGVATAGLREFRSLIHESRTAQEHLRPVVLAGSGRA